MKSHEHAHSHKNLFGLLAAVRRFESVHYSTLLPVRRLFLLNHLFGFELPTLLLDSHRGYSSDYTFPTHDRWLKIWLYTAVGIPISTRRCHNLTSSIILVGQQSLAVMCRCSTSWVGAQMTRPSMFVHKGIGRNLAFSKDIDILYAHTQGWQYHRSSGWQLYFSTLGPMMLYPRTPVAWPRDPH